MYSVLNRHIAPLLDTIAKEGGLDEYKYLIDSVRSTDVSKDLAFQSVYRSYWQMGAARLNATFCRDYFAYIEDLKVSDDINLERIAIQLYRIESNARGDRKLHFSFSTKLAHMLRPEMPVYDSLVAQFYFLAEKDGSFDERLQDRMGSYAFLLREYRRVLDDGLLDGAIDAFRTRFEMARTFTDTKIIDALIWRFAGMLGQGAIRDGRVKYL